MVRIARCVVFSLQHLYARPPIGFEAKIIGFIVTRFIRQAVGVVFVRGKSRPSALAYGKELADQKPSNFIMLLLAQNMFDFTVGLGVIGSILHKIMCAHIKGRENFIIFCASYESFGVF